MELIMEHWLSMTVGIYLVAMVLYGHYRGFLRMAVSLGHWSSVSLPFGWQCLM